MNLVCGSHSIVATVQVQAAAPTALLIGTDVLPQLGFRFLQDNCTGSQDLLQGNRDDQACTKEGETMAESPPSDKEYDATVRLLHATRIPPRHAKLVRVQAQGNCKPTVSLFSPDCGHKPQQPEYVVQLDDNSSFVFLLENHTCWPISFSQGDILGTLQDVSFLQEAADLPNNSKSVGSGTVPQSSVIAHLESFDKQSTDRVRQLREALRMDHSYLSADEQQQVEALVQDYQDVFSLSAMELGTTQTMSHSIDTGTHTLI